MYDVPSLVLGPLIRRGDDSQFSVWVETSKPCQVTVLGATSATFALAGHHYGIVDLPELSVDATEYEVHLDDALVWPDPALGVPPSRIRIWSEGEPLVISGGSCRQQAPQMVPTVDSNRAAGMEATEELGVDALAALANEAIVNGRRLPNLLLLTGDQVYADERHPSVTESLWNRRGGPPAEGWPEVTSFEEYTWLYQKTWAHPLIRWILSCVPSLMIFDDHDVIDDWNISDTWVADISTEPWWQDRLQAALMSYWVYQHIGNLSSAERNADPIFVKLTSSDDGEQALRDHVRAVGTGPGRYEVSWSYNVEIGPVNVIVMDARNGRVLEPERRSMLSVRDWEFLDQALSQNPNVLLVSSVPWLLPAGVHSLERLVSQTVAGRWGRRGRKIAERLRREIDLEHWPAFGASVEMLTARLRNHVRSRTPDVPPVVFSGDVHFAYVAAQPLGEDEFAYQIVSSPLRQGDQQYEQLARWAAMTSTFDRVMRRLHGRGFGRSVAKARHRLLTDVWTRNNIATVRYSYATDGSLKVNATLEHADVVNAQLRLCPLVSRDLAPKISKMPTRARFRA